MWLYHLIDRRGFELRYTSVNWIHIGTRHTRYFCQILKYREARDSMFYVSPNQFNNFFFFCLNKKFKENSFQS